MAVGVLANQTNDMIPQVFGLPLLYNLQHPDHAPGIINDANAPLLRISGCNSQPVISSDLLKSRKHIPVISYQILSDFTSCDNNKIFIWIVNF